MNNTNKEIFSFLEELKLNNNRVWFENNKNRFLNIKNDIKLVSSKIVDQMNSHDSIESSKIFRIYRDVRFSKNKTPYKTNLGISFKRSSPNLRGGYYFHIKPNESFIACGFFSPNKEDLLRIRKELEIDSDEFRDILNNKSIKNHWGDIDGDPLKTSPRGFLKNSPNIDLIRMKRFIFFKKYSDDSFFSSNLVEKISSDFRIMRPFLDYMSMVLTTDLNGISVLEK
tara:strand:+ start:1192 stop:1869 length:678 start_codon:yes stop_codon:yes gene_type:complete